MKKIHLISDKDILNVLSPRDAVSRVREAFRLYALGKVDMPSKIYIKPKGGDFRAMPAHINSRKGITGIKWINVYPQNYKRGLPCVDGHILLNDSKTGQLKALMEANVLTAYRTGAAGALASKMLAAKKKSYKILLIGAGAQSVYQLKCHRAVMPISDVFIWSINDLDSKKFAKQNNCEALNERNFLEVARKMDIICTCTPSRKPVLKYAWLQKGVHINAIGADAPGKQELDLRIIRDSKIIVDDWDQASHSGEINKAVSKGVLTRSKIAGILGQYISGQKKWIRKVSDITVFDSTGLAVQDMVLADYCLNKLNE